MFFIGAFLDEWEWALLGIITLLLTIYFSTFLLKIDSKLKPYPPFYWNVRVFILYVLFNYISIVFFNSFITIGLLALVLIYPMAIYHYKQAIKKREEPEKAYWVGVFSAVIGLFLAGLLIWFFGLII